jgi:hypothetical protein
LCRPWDCSAFLTPFSLHPIQNENAGDNESIRKKRRFHTHLIPPPSSLLNAHHLADFWQPISDTSPSTSLYVTLQSTLPSPGRGKVTRSSSDGCSSQLCLRVLQAEFKYLDKIKEQAIRPEVIEDDLACDREEDKSESEVPEVREEEIEVDITDTEGDQAADEMECVNMKKSVNGDEGEECPKTIDKGICGGEESEWNTNSSAHIIITLIKFIVTFPRVIPIHLWVNLLNVTQLIL